MGLAAHCMDGPKRTYEYGARFITAAWQLRVRERMDELGWKQKDLAEALGATPGAITGLLAPAAEKGAKTSKLVVPASSALDIPTPEFTDERDEKLIKGHRRLRDKNPRAYDKLFVALERYLEEEKDPQ